MSNLTTTDNTMNTEPETIDCTPTWEVTTQLLLRIIKDSTNLENKQWAESEVLRMASILDELQKRTDELEKTKERQYRVLERRNLRIADLGDKLFNMKIDLETKDDELRSLKNSSEVQKEDMKKLRDKNRNLNKLNRQAGDRIIELQHQIDEDKRCEKETTLPMPSHEEIAVAVDRRLKGWRDCSSSHNREDLEDLVRDLVRYNNSIASADEYHKANKL